MRRLLVVSSLLLVIASCTKSRTEAPTERRPVSRQSAGPVSVGTDTLAPKRHVLSNAFSYAITAHNSPTTVKVGDRPVVVVKVRNTSDRVWAKDGAVKLGFYWTDSTGEVLKGVEGRSLCKADVAPGATADFPCEVKVPAKPGEYVLVWDMVEEHVTWFGKKGARPVTLPVTVLPSSSS